MFELVRCEINLDENSLVRDCCVQIFEHFGKNQKDGKEKKVVRFEPGKNKSCGDQQNTELLMSPRKFKTKLKGTHTQPG